MFENRARKVTQFEFDGKRLLYKERRRDFPVLCSEEGGKYDNREMNVPLIYQCLVFYFESLPKIK
jgi:hypothetical protein